MNVNLIFTIVTTLDFTARFAINPNDTPQNHFVLSGENTSAHLYQENTTLKLYLRLNSSYQLYELDGVINSFDFLWNGFMVNGRQMELKRSEGNLTSLSFDAYTFVAPIELWNYEIIHEIVTECVYQREKQNYVWFACIFFAVGILLKFDVIGPKVAQKVIKYYSPELEGDYVAMENL